MLNKKKNNTGFTLVELLVVIAIIGILAVVAVPALFKNINKAKVADLQADYNAIKSATLSYYTDKNELPTDVTGSLDEYMDSVPNKSALGEGAYDLSQEELPTSSGKNSLFLVLGNLEKACTNTDGNHGSQEQHNCDEVKGTGVTLTKEQIGKLKSDMGANMVFIGNNEAEGTDSGEGRVLKLKLIDNVSSVEGN